MSVYDFTVRDIRGNEVSLADYRGKVLLIVNTATHCGFTPQYTALQELYERHKDKGFVVLDFPSNQFGKQAPGSSEEIHQFCIARFALTFPQFEKVDVNGNDASPRWCTVSNPSRFFSHRRDAVSLGSSGRMAACVWLQP